MPHAIRRLLPSQNGTHANPPTNRAKNTPSVVIAIGRLQERTFDHFHPTLISVVTILLHTQGLHDFRTGPSSCRERGSDVIAFSAGFFCKNRPIALAMTPKVPGRYCQKDVPRYGATVGFWQIAPVLEPEDRPLHHKISFVRASESRHTKCGQHTLHRSAGGHAIGDKRLPCSNGSRRTRGKFAQRVVDRGPVSWSLSQHDVEREAARPRRDA